MGVHRKWKYKKLKKPKIPKKYYFKGNNILYFYYRGYDISYRKSYKFTGNYNDYGLYYCHYKNRDDYVLIELKHNAIKNKSISKLYDDVIILLESIGIDIESLELEIKLNRIDYKHDFECEYKPEEKHKAIMSVISKTKDSYNGVHKEKLKKVLE